MCKRIRLLIVILCFPLLLVSAQETTDLKKLILNNAEYERVKEMAYDILKTGFNAGDGYNQVWARDLNTFIRHSCKVLHHDTVRRALSTFFFFQGFDGNMVDGYEQVPAGYIIDNYGVYERYDMPGYVFHKNTVETDQETSLIQAVYKYVQETGDKSILEDNVNGMSILDRMEKMLDYLMKHRYNEKYGLIWGATTADWGDVQSKHKWGVKLDELSVPSIDIYDNAMMLIAIDNYISLSSGRKPVDKWTEVYSSIRKNIRKYLWDEQNDKFIPHIYIRFKEYDNIDENDIYYHGGTIVAIEAGLLSSDEILTSLSKMRENVLNSGAGSIGLTLYPPYPEGSFENKGMGPYQYQNGGDWTWFGARMIAQLVKNGFIEEAITELQPFVSRVISNNGFFEWYTIEEEPRGSGIFRGSAGVLLDAIEALEAYATNH